MAETSRPIPTAHQKRQKALDEFVNQLNAELESSAGDSATASIPTCFTKSLTEPKEPECLTSLFDKYRAAGYDVSIDYERNMSEERIGNYFRVIISWAI